MGSRYSQAPADARVAQGIEQSFPKAKVAGSNPAVGAAASNVFVGSVLVSQQRLHRFGIAFSQQQLAPGIKVRAGIGRGGAFG